jgi:hypothetical protein
LWTLSQIRWILRVSTTWTARSMKQFRLLIQWLYRSVAVTSQSCSSRLSFSSLFCCHLHFCYCSIPLLAFED